MEVNFTFRFKNGANSDSLCETRSVMFLPRIGEKISFSSKGDDYVYYEVMDVLHDLGENRVTIYYGDCFTS